jgi:hypothetical protein
MHLPALQPPSPLDTAAALPHVPGLSPARSTTAAPPRPGPIGGRCAQPLHPPDAGEQARSGTVPVFTVLRSTKEEPDYAPAVSLRVRRRLSSQPPWRLMTTAAGVPCRPTILGRCAPLPAPIHQVRAGAASRGDHTPVPRVLLSVPLAEPGPSGGAGPSRRCQGCSHPPRHHPARAAPSSAVPLRQDQRRRSLTSTRNTAPHGALMTLGTPAGR